MEEAGVINADTVRIEPTSGNTGHCACLCRGFARLSAEAGDARVDVDRTAEGACLFGCRDRADSGVSGHEGSDRDREDLWKSTPNSAMPQQFKNLANPDIHRRTTAEEIWNDTGGNIDSFVAGVGTGGTITGAGRVLKPRRPQLQVVAVEPEESLVLSGGQHSPHKIRGIGAGFVPDILDRSVIDEIVKINSQTAIETSRALARNEGIPGGIFSGAAVAAALEIGRRPQSAGKTILAIVPSFSTALFEGI